LKNFAWFLIFCVFSPFVRAAEPQVKWGVPWYEVLGFTLEEVRTATDGEITRAHSNLAKKYFPRTVSLPEEDKSQMLEAMKIINAAYQDKGGAKDFMDLPKESRATFGATAAAPPAEPEPPPNPYAAGKVKPDMPTLQMLHRQFKNKAQLSSIVEALRKRWETAPSEERASVKAKEGDLYALMTILEPLYMQGEGFLPTAQSKLEFAKEITLLKKMQPGTVTEPLAARAWDALHQMGTMGYVNVLESAERGEPVTRDQVLEAFAGRFAHARTANPRFVTDLLWKSERAFQRARGDFGDPFIEEALRKHGDILFADAEKAKLLVEGIRAVTPLVDRPRMMGEVAKAMDAIVHSLDVADIERSSTVRKDLAAFRKLAHDVAVEVLRNPQKNFPREAAQTLAIRTLEDQSYEGMKKYLGIQEADPQRPDLAERRNAETTHLFQQILDSGSAGKLLHHPDRARRLSRLLALDLLERTAPEAEKKRAVLDSLAERFHAASSKEKADLRQMGESLPLDHNGKLRTYTHMLRNLQDEIVKLDAKQREFERAKSSPWSLRRLFGGGNAVCLLVMMASQ